MKSLIIPFIQSADTAASLRAAGGSRPTSGESSLPSSAVIAGDHLAPDALYAHLAKVLPFSTNGQDKGKEAVLAAVSQILTYSVNTWDQGFLDKLYSSPTPVGLIAELLVATLNTNVHVYSVSPALTVVEKHTARALASLFGFKGPYAGGITVAGGSASNLTSLIIARSHLYPETKEQGNGSAKFVIFTSQHGHYSLDKAAIISGIGKSNVRLVPVDGKGQMRADALEEMISQAGTEGFTPLYVNATAGTTVLGSYDPLEEIAAVCKRKNVWMHVDASWGGPVVFSPELRASRLEGIELADSVTVNPHKMLNVPVTCSFLLGPDMRVFRGANRTDASYLFHGDEDVEDDDAVWDLADLTLQCGRRGDALKMALAWVYYGTEGLTAQVSGAFAQAEFLAGEIRKREPVFALASEDVPPCLQVCFYYRYSDEGEGEKNTATTVAMVKKLRSRGFMVDYASFPPGFRSGEEGKIWKGSFFRVAVNVQTRRETVVGLVQALEEVGNELR